MPSKMFSFLSQAGDAREVLDLESDADSAADEIEDAEQRQRKELALAQRDSSVPWFVPYVHHANPGEGSSTPHQQAAQNVYDTETERSFVVRRGLAASGDLELDLSDTAGEDEDGVDDYGLCSCGPTHAPTKAPTKAPAGAPGSGGRTVTPARPVA